VAQELTLEVVPGAIVLEGEYAWMCFPPTSAGVMCVKVHSSKFCPTEALPPGILKCIVPMMADDEQKP